MSAFLFRAAVGVVNGAACAVNHFLETMYPREDIGAIWFDDELAAPCADPHPAGAADPAGGTPPPPAGSPSNSGVCDCKHLLHPGNVCAACGCNYSRLAATPTAQSLTEIYLGLSEVDLWAAAHYVDCWSAASEWSDNPFHQFHQVRLQDLATRLRDASRNLRVNQ